MDVKPVPLSITWGSGHMEVEYIGEHLEYFLLHGNMLDHWSCTLVGIPGNCAPIILKWMGGKPWKGIPLKFNRLVRRLKFL